MIETLRTGRLLFCVCGVASLLSIDSTAEVMEAENADALSLESVQLSGAARIGYVNADANAGTDGFDVRQIHLFFDAVIAEDMPMADRLRLWVEWDFIRRGETLNDVGDAYAEFTALGGKDWLNARVGRFQVPFGEEYTLFSAGAYDNPLAEYSVIRGYGWDEGVMLFGEVDPDTHLAYTVFACDGEKDFNTDSSSDEMLGVKLSVEPHPSLYLSGSIMTQGRVGSTNRAAESSWSFGGYHPAGRMGAVLDGMDVWELDAKLRPMESIELWAAYGEADIDDGGDGAYDRELEYLILQALIEGSALGADNAWAESFYGVIRYSSIATSSSREGYRFLVYGGFPLGFGIHEFEVLQLGIGYHIDENAKIIVEYDHVDLSLASGASGETGNRDMLIVDLALRF